MDFQLEKTTAQFIVLLLESILHFKIPPVPPLHGGGGSEEHPTYLSPAQTEALAAEGVSLLARYLPSEAAQKVTSAVEHLARPPQVDREHALLRLGALGAVIPQSGDPAPGCCVFWPGRGMVCVR